jgi:hypothetical protein
MSKIAVTPIAQALAAADAAMEKGFTAAVEGVARAMGTKPTIEHGEATAKEFQGAYQAARGCTEKTAQNRWTAIVDALAKEYGQEKPKATTKGAEKKAAQREKAAEEAKAVLASVPADAPAETLMAKAAELTKAGDAKAAKALTDAALTKAREAAKQAAKAASEAVKAEREKARKAIGDCTDAALLRAVCDLLASPAHLAQVVAVLAKPAPQPKGQKAGKPVQQLKGKASPAPVTAMAEALKNAGVAPV